MIEKVDDIRLLAVVGAGTMGLGIAQLAAMANIKTILFDIDEEILKKAHDAIIKNLDKGIEKGKINEALKAQTLENITLEKDINNIKADFIIEAVVERLEVKHSIFKQLEEINSQGTILATNTSSIPITQIAEALKRPHNVVGMHFFNPAHIMKLVEVISGASTNEHVVKLTYDLAVKLGKTPVSAADSPGFIVNRVARHFYVESLKIAEENLADFKTIDKLIRASGFKMGPFELMDLIGVDTNFSVTTSMFNAFHQDSKFRPSRIQQQKVDAGHHGRKAGQGFYNYE